MKICEKIVLTKFRKILITVYRFKVVLWMKNLCMVFPVIIFMR